jgi:hypothetical protein
MPASDSSGTRAGQLKARGADNGSLVRWRGILVHPQSLEGALKNF